MPSFFIFAWSVVGLTASRSAAPPLPLTRQCAPSRAARMARRSASASVTPETPGACRTRGGSAVTDAIRIASTSTAVPLLRMTARSMTFCSSRILPGHSYARSRIERGRRDAVEMPAQSAREMPHEIAGELRDIVPPFAQGRQAHREHAQAVVQVRPELSGPDRLLEILVGGGDHPHVNLDGLRGADALHVPVLQHPQQLGLRLLRQVADPVEEHCAAMGDFELAGLAGDGAREGAFLVPKSSLSTSASGRAAESTGTNGPRLRLLRSWMNLASISLPLPVSPSSRIRRVARRGERRLLDRLFERRALADDLPENPGDPDVFLEMSDMVAQTLLLLEQ